MCLYTKARWAYSVHAAFTSRAADAAAHHCSTIACRSRSSALRSRRPQCRRFASAPAGHKRPLAGSAAAPPFLFAASTTRMKPSTRTAIRRTYRIARQFADLAENRPESSSIAVSTSFRIGSVTEAGERVSSLNRMPAGVARCARVFAGTCCGSSLRASACHRPGSNSAASRAAWSLALPRAATCDGSAKKRRRSGTRRYGTVRYCSRSSASDGRSALSKLGSCFRCSTSSSLSMRGSPPTSARTRAVGSAEDGGARGRSARPSILRNTPPIHEPSPCSACLAIAAELSTRPKPVTMKPSSVR